MERSSRSFLPSQALESSRHIFASLNRYFTENSRWVPLNLMVPLISTEVACLILTSKPHDITHLFFRFKITCALTYVAKNASVEINLKLIITLKKMLFTIFLENLFSILFLLADRVPRQ